jgi:UDP-glucose 4-epimerase
MAVRPMCSYGVSKLTIEHYLDVYKHLARSRLCGTAILQPVTGSAKVLFARLGALTVFLHRTLKGQGIEIWGDGGVTRDFIYVGDVANAVYLATVKPVSGVFNVGTGSGSFSSRRIWFTFRTLSAVANPSVTWLPSRSFDVPRIVLDASKLRNATNWHCVTSVRDGVGITADWLRATDI